MASYEHLLRPRTTRILQEATPLRRLGAFIIDVLLLDILVTAPFAPLFAGMLGRMDADGIAGFTYTARELALVMTVFLVAYAYFVLCEYLLGQTAGMFFLGTTVRELSLWQALVRNSFLLPLFPFILFWIIEPIAVLTTRLGVLERLSGTRTVRQTEVIF